MTRLDNVLSALPETNEPPRPFGGADKKGWRRQAECCKALILSLTRRFTGSIRGSVARQTRRSRARIDFKGVSRHWTAGRRPASTLTPRPTVRVLSVTSADGSSQTSSDVAETSGTGEEMTPH